MSYECNIKSNSNQRISNQNLKNQPCLLFFSHKENLNTFQKLYDVMDVIKL